jgi:hypothetical protein
MPRHTSESPSDKVQLIFDFLAYAKHNGKVVADRFDAGPVVFINHVLKRDGCLAPQDVRKLDNIITGFTMRAFEDKPYYMDWKGTAVIPAYIPPPDPGCLIVSDDDEDRY